MICKAVYKSPIGNIEISGNGDAIIGLRFVEEQDQCHHVFITESSLLDTTATSSGHVTKDSMTQDTLSECAKQLDEYFTGKRTRFDIPLAIYGTDFQKNVWKALQEIPFGETKSYMEIASNIDNEKAVRAVGTANGKNAIPIIIPCHRVINNDGRMGGFSAGIWRKEWLLEHENNGYLFLSSPESALA